MKVYSCSAFVRIAVSYNIYCQIEICSDGAVRLTGGSTSLVGVVEVCAGSSWGTVCGNDWNDATASIVCRQLGYQNGI